MYNNTSRLSSNVNIAQNIKKFRQKKGWTQETLARKANISYNTIIKLETNGIKDPRISTLKKIADVLSIEIDDLI